MQYSTGFVDLICFIVVLFLVLLVQLDSIVLLLKV